MDERMKVAKVTMLWIIVECPSCLRPQTFQKHVLDNMVINLQQTRYMTCEYCDEGFFVEFKAEDFAIQ